MNDQINAADQNPAPPQMQIQIGGGLLPQPNGTFICHLWFSQLPNEATARQFMTQLDGMVKQMFSPPPPAA